MLTFNARYICPFQKKRINYELIPNEGNKVFP